MIAAGHHKGETADERRLRKGAVKADRRARREAKKTLKGAYKSEALRQKAMVAAREPLGKASLIL
jgi:hypothetical protein